MRFITFQQSRKFHFAEDRAKRTLCGDFVFDALLNEPLTISKYDLLCTVCRDIFLRTRIYEEEENKALRAQLDEYKIAIAAEKKHRGEGEGTQAARLLTEQVAAVQWPFVMALAKETLNHLHQLLGCDDNVGVYVERMSHPEHDAVRSAGDALIGYISRL